MPTKTQTTFHKQSWHVTAVVIVEWHSATGSEVR